jgi:hypothetical protein
MADLLPGGGVQGRGAVPGHEVVLGREPGHAGDVDRSRAAPAGPIPYRSMSMAPYGATRSAART